MIVPRIDSAQSDVQDAHDSRDSDSMLFIQVRIGGRYMASRLVHTPTNVCMIGAIGLLLSYAMPVVRSPSVLESGRTGKQRT